LGREDFFLNWAVLVSLPPAQLGKTIAPLFSKAASFLRERLQA
jgi:hypothetical protein